jgi:hypothetical protein
MELESDTMGARRYPDCLKGSPPRLNPHRTSVHRGAPAGKELLYQDEPATAVGLRQEVPPLRKPGNGFRHTVALVLPMKWRLSVQIFVNVAEDVCSANPSEVRAGGQEPIMVSPVPYQHIPHTKVPEHVVVSVVNVE